jgi:hypothetical protein
MADEASPDKSAQTRIIADAPDNATELQDWPGDIDVGDGEVPSPRLLFMQF